MNSRFANAKRYYYLVLRELLLAADEQYRSEDEIIGWAIQNFAANEHIGVKIAKHRAFLRICIHDFIENGWVDPVSDEFASLFIRKNSHLEKALNSDKKLLGLYEKYDSLAQSKEDWMRSAISSIADEFLIDELTQHVTQSNGSDSNANTAGPMEADTWEPLPIDRADSAYGDAIKKTERALEVLEQDNGYAATSPEEKAGIVETIRGNLKALKEGFPSKRSIMEGLIKPLKFIAKKFGENFVGAAASAAIKALASYFGFPL
jgi:hypothetical protein